MIQHFHRMISAALGISEKQIVQTLGLLNDGATIPFISRYRKEVTGGLDEVHNFFETKLISQHVYFF